jgi:hypothetical protein
MKRRFDEFKAKNNKFYSSGKLLPDSVVANFMNKKIPKP